MVNLRGEDTSDEQAKDAPLLPRSSVRQQVDLTWRDLLPMITQRKRLVAIATAICAGIAVAAAFRLPPEYTAYVTILAPQWITNLGPTISDSPNTTKKEDASNWLDIAVPPRKNNNEMYLSMLKSQSVEDAVIQRYALQSEFNAASVADARDDLERHTNLNQSAKDGLIRLSYTDRDPKRSAEIANGYADLFKAVSQNLALREASQRRFLFEKQLKKTSADQSIAEDALNKAQLVSGSVQIDEKSVAALESAARLRAQIVAKQIQIEAMSWYARDNDPALTLAQTQLDGLHGNLNKLAKANRRGPLGNVLLTTSSAPTAQQEYLRRLRDVKYARAESYLLARHLELARLDEAREDASITVVDPAVIPGEMSSPQRKFIVVGGVVAGLTLGIMLALLQGGLHRMQQIGATRNKLTLLKMSLWLNSSSRGMTEAGGRQEELPICHAG